MIRCENDYCIYYQNSSCVFDDVSINCLGSCSKFTIVRIPKNELIKLRAKQLREDQTREDLISEQKLRGERLLEQLLRDDKLKEEILKNELLRRSLSKDNQQK